MRKFRSRLEFFRFLRGKSCDSSSETPDLSEPWFVMSPRQHAPICARLCAM